MTVQKALKEKSKLLNELQELYTIVARYNSIDEATPRRYDIPSVMVDIDEVTSKLIELKTKIHVANVPVYDKIFRLSELKTMVKKYKSISTDEGPSEGRYGSAARTLVVDINVVDMSNIVKSLEAEIDKLQSELDVHNHTTSI